MSKKDDAKTYGLGERSATEMIAAPQLPYLVQDPKEYNPNIALVGCGGITTHHLSAYKKAGYRVVALCDTNLEAANNARRNYFPEAKVYSDYKEVLKRDDIEVVDFATHPKIRYPMMVEAVEAKKHILSQKPFVMDLDAGERLVEASVKANVKIAVNQNGRWAPHFSYMRQVIAAGLIGEVAAVHMHISWNHNWVAGTPFEDIHNLILFDFGIHWFDMMTTFMRAKEVKNVYAVTEYFPEQTVKPPMLAQVALSYKHAVGSISFNADTLFGEEDWTVIIGRKGTLRSFGPDLNEQKVVLHTNEGVASPDLEGTWFPDGFHGAMAELLCAIEEQREPENSGRNNLDSLALCFAAIESAKSGKAIKPGTVRNYNM
ncbi:MAG: Gfo/Idh/MocA family oxidoreductase [Sphaerochaetaceae bacterium]|jgi:predicted dehydrogenase|nr:Gfo/Idh/MocA family oxidoreductase [Sphaerochaetaceae bacterium]MDY0372106.1 Gfo/Idh/MocA family oxidoreductase [Sphaerochaetaceae bacterium]